MNGLELKKKRTELGLNQIQLGKLLGKSKRTVVEWEKNTEFTQSQKVQIDAVFNKSEVTAPSILKESSNTIKEKINISETNEQESPKTFKGVPAYGVEVTSHVTTSFNDIPESPEFYVDYKPFNDCTCYVINYGDSMHPEYKSGERLAVKQIFNLDVICWGEAYLVVTNGNANDLRGVKRVHFHKDLSKVILRSSNPLYAGDMVINKEDIVSMYIVKGKISQNSI
ncbi:helix-turn-helix domain-containing protein [Tenacibaculum piscium]|nr:helix-turn-helix domain-containing protein [Tenacibaculum piscium]